MDFKRKSSALKYRCLLICLAAAVQGGMSTGDIGSAFRDSATVRLRVRDEATGNPRQVRAHTVACCRKHVCRSVSAHA